jgi:hypothetical protein
MSRLNKSMKILPKFAFAICSVLWAPHLTANAQSHHISDSPILPYIIDNPNSANSVIRLRCFTKGRERQAKQGFIRDRLLQTPNYYPNYITIEVEGSCHNVKIRLPNNSNTDYVPLDEPIYGDYWLYREGSGWNWLKRETGFLR